MKKTVFVVALLGTTAAMAPGAFATGWGGWMPPIYIPPTTDSSSCDTLCDPLRDDYKQELYGIQQAINQIVDIDDAIDVVQKAVNAGNLIDMATGDDPDIGLGTLIQKADVRQVAHNLIDGGKLSEFDDLSQAATNVVNSISGDLAWNIDQSVKNAQIAKNEIFGGSGGYDADLGDTDLADALTQTAVNASNLVELDTLKNDIKQYSNSSQTALNTATFESSLAWGWHGPYFNTPDVWDLGQSATNVTNTVSVGNIDLSGACACDFEIQQYANANQLAQNVLSTMGDVHNIVQSATNVANSIGLPTPPASN